MLDKVGMKKELYISLPSGIFPEKGKYGGNTVQRNK